MLLFDDGVAAELGDECEQISASNTSVDDPLYGCQWHLNNEGQLKGATDGEDINVEDAWAVTLGAGINVAVVDDGLQYDHPDLTDNVDTSRNHDYTGGGEVYDPVRIHGTAMAGIIAARDNSIGVRGVAPRATVYVYNYLRNQTPGNRADAMVRNMADTAVSSNSWGGRGPAPNRAADGGAWAEAVDKGVTEGFGGNGVFYVTVAGNDARSGGYSTLDEQANYYAVTTACAVNDLGRRASYSERGANLWVCAPASDGTRSAIATTTTLGRYMFTSGGTSAAAAQVSGVAALVRSVDRGTESALSWRDVKLILAASARKNDPDDTGWETGALKYRSSSESYEYNYSYGFGVVDAKAAVDLAADWSNLPPMLKTGSHTDSRRLTVPTSGSTVSRSVSVSSDIDFAEFVAVNTDFNSRDFRNLQVELQSPSGTVSVLSVPETGDCPNMRGTNTANCSLTQPFRFGTARHLGEDPSGTWTLRVRDTVGGGWTTYLDSWSITVYGHSGIPGAPSLNHVDPGADRLTVSWNTPDHTGTTAITGYEVRYIRSDSRNKASDSAWTVVDDAATASDTEYTIESLNDTVRRDVQVRAVNGSGTGPWSVTARGTPSAANSEPFFVDGESTVRTIDETDIAGTAIGSPIAARDAENDTFTYTLGGTDASVFDVDTSSGQLQVKDHLDHETDDTYNVVVSVSDRKDNAGNADTATDASISVTVTVADVDEPPELVGDTDLDYLENGTAEVIRYTAEDPEGGMVEPLVLSGTDQDDFHLRRRQARVRLFARLREPDRPERRQRLRGGDHRLRRDPVRGRARHRNRRRRERGVHPGGRHHPRLRRGRHRPDHHIRSGRRPRERTHRLGTGGNRPGRLHHRARRDLLRGGARP